ncbi:MAG: hypothetical protein MZV65_51940 [Chromatiales bacterium]|nr:hypothetical protein [Chromatiales bacterium]
MPTGGDAQLPRHARAACPTTLVYQMTKALFDNLDTLVRRARRRQGDQARERAIKGMPVPLHPGAEKLLPRSRPHQVESRTPARRRAAASAGAARAAADDQPAPPCATPAAAAAEAAHGTALPRAIFAVAIAFSSFQIVTAAFSPHLQPGGAGDPRRLPAADGVRCSYPAALARSAASMALAWSLAAASASRSASTTGSSRPT